MDRTPVETLDRRRVEAALDRAVRAHRFTIAVTVPAVGAALFLASARGWLPVWLSFAPALVLLGAAVMGSPLIAGLAPLVDRRAVVGLLALAVFSYAVEVIAVATGLPYGRFVYGPGLGPTLLGTVPAGLPVFYVPLVIDAVLLAVLLLGPRADRPVVRFGVALAALVGFDLGLDPAAVSLGLWRYLDGGSFYGVPLSNYAGWLASGALAVLAVEYAFDWRDLRVRLATCPYLLDGLVGFAVLWGLVNAAFGNWIPAALAALLVAALARVDQFDLPVPRWASRA